MVIFPVRHHSPTAAIQVERLIRELRPRVILVEGPADATPLIPLLLDPATVPPVALYAYRTGEQVRASFYPFCDYSPEYVALRVGHELGAELGFCDVPAAVTLTWGEDDAGSGGDREDELLSKNDYNSFAATLTEAAGFSTFEEFWEAAFEQEVGRRSPAGYLEALTDFGEKVRTLTIPSRALRDSLREQHMAAAVREAIGRELSPDAVMLVCGAAHAQAIAETLRGDAPPPLLEPGAAVEIALIPFSFLRLSEQSGYGAGNRAPWFYQRVWERHGDYHAATRHALVVVGQHLRRQGHGASLAQCIDAYGLAVTLAGMRGKDAPGVDEVSEAAVACLGQGQPALVGSALKRVLLGDVVGQITSRTGRTPLQSEFYVTAQRLGLPVLDAPRQVLLHMILPVEAEQSVFLHRLVAARIPFARELRSGLGGRGRAATGGPLEQLGRVLEKWELQWSPSTDAQLIERTAWGSTLVEVCERTLTERLAAASRVDAGAAVLLGMALCELVEAFPPALERCEMLAADSSSFPSLAQATYYLDGLLSHGSARRLPVDRLTVLAARLFGRAALHLPSAAACGDEAAAEVSQTLIALHELVERRGAIATDLQAFWSAIETVAEMPGAHPGLRGLALVLLEMGGRLARGELATRLAYWLSLATDAEDNARLVAGLFSLHRGTLVRNRALIGAVTDFLRDLDIEQLTPLLPVLRRSLGNLSPAERSYLEETLVAILGLGSDEAARVLRVSSADEALLREADASVAAVLAEWGERYGIE